MTKRFWIVLTLIVALFAVQPAQAYEYTVPSGLGVSTAWQRGDVYKYRSLHMLQPPVWMNWLYTDLDDPSYLPMAYSLAPSAQANYLAVATTNPHRLWLLGNEPNLPGTFVSPQDAASSVQMWAQQYWSPIACCGQLIYPGVWLHHYTTWTRAYLDAGGPVPDYWHIHIYTSPPMINPVFHIDEFRDWMFANNVVRPVIVTEGNATTGTIDNQILYMNAMEASLDNGKIHAFLWYSDRDWHNVWPNSNLISYSGTEPLRLGRHWLTLQ